MYLTEAGNIYLKTVCDIQNILNSTYRSINELDQPIMQQLKIGISPQRGAAILSEIYPEFYQNFSNIRCIPIEGYGKPLKEMLLLDKIDMAIAVGEVSKGLKAYPFQQEEIVLAVPAIQDRTNNIFCKGDAYPYASLLDFRDSVFIMPEDSTELSAIIKPLFNDAGYSPKIAFSTPNVLMMSQMISSGLGIGLLPGHYAHNTKLKCYRLHQKIFMEMSLFVKDDHLLTKEERFLFWLILKYYTYKLENQNSLETILWNDFNKGLLDEFSNKF